MLTAYFFHSYKSHVFPPFPYERFVSLCILPCIFLPITCIGKAHSTVYWTSHHIFFVKLLLTITSHCAMCCQGDFVLLYCLSIFRTPLPPPSSPPPPPPPNTLQIWSKGSFYGSFRHFGLGHFLTLPPPPDPRGFLGKSRFLESCSVKMSGSVPPPISSQLLQSTSVAIFLLLSFVVVCLFVVVFLLLFYCGWGRGVGGGVYFM